MVPQRTVKTQRGDWMQVPGRQKRAVSPPKAGKLESRRGGICTKKREFRLG